MSQRWRIVEGLIETLGELGAPGRVHVIGGPEEDDGSLRGVVPGERLCGSPDHGEGVVFHVQAEEEPFGRWWCPCGASSGPMRDEWA